MSQQPLTLTDLPIRPEIETAPVIVATLTHDGRLLVTGCRVCPARKILCDECVIPDLITVQLTDTGEAALCEQP